MTARLYRFLSYLLPILALAVVVKGAYVRLSDAGLGCPDWPGCYGQVVVPKSEAEIRNPDHLAARPLESGKAWREMIHRYIASMLGAGILLLAACAWRRRRLPEQPAVVPLLLVPLVVFQGLLGMWTVTLLLKPLIVMAHLLGGFAVFGLLIWNLLQVRAWRARPTGRVPDGLRGVALAGLAVVFVQAALGGWTSANYAALACTDFPTCQGRLWPAHMDFGEAFVLWRGLGVNFEFGVLETPARTAIHVSHRLGALITTLVVLFIVGYIWRTAAPRGRRIGWCILALLAIQIALGITNVVRGLPLVVAVSHNGVAALLFAAMIALFHYASRPTTKL